MQLHILCCWIWIKTVGLDFFETQFLVKSYCRLHTSQGVQSHFFIPQVHRFLDEFSKVRYFFLHSPRKEIHSIKLGIIQMLL
jgi:hypothetical protein